MNLIYLMKIRLKRSFKEPILIIFILVAILVSTGAAYFSKERMEMGLTVAVISEDEGEMGERVLDILRGNKEFRMLETEKDKGLKLLKQDRLEAMIVISSNLTEKLKAGDYTNTMELYLSPSAKAPATVSEVAINAVMMLWVEEAVVEKTKDYIREQGGEYTPRDEIIQRKRNEDLWESGSEIGIKWTLVEGDEEPEVAAAREPVDVNAKWFSVLCLFFLLSDGIWVLDLGKRGLSNRLRQGDVPKWKLICAGSIPTFIISFSGYIVSCIATLIILGGGVLAVLKTLLPMVIYLFGSVGMTLFVISAIKNNLSLMFLTPAITFLSAIFSGVFSQMPKWAYVLEKLSLVLPGKWFVVSLENAEAIFPGALMLSLFWICAGLVFSAFSKTKAPS